ncbi:GntR family transcriptional regulator [Burkholderia sp. SRS-W-2-2016]|uniref:GntR family transcriptional regulator n=1 Tax=Burkholderia sp. SRS-W-2-2016 TaxID=1926878 RepID=UPI00094AB8E1|nr:GntR family transcriptional regulator [Burkholderia sp. SRS-W-2-2016]OLL29226.1 GntR family transcriptional regulator [Burkholderia sp. SRS-W-2-2016]
MSASRATPPARSAKHTSSRAPARASRAAKQASAAQPTQSTPQAAVQADHSDHHEPADARRPSSTEAAYRELRRRIIESELTPGTQLLEQELALLLGFSRTPIREAAVRLQSEGLVRIVPRRGIRIVPVSLSDIRHIYEVLISLESTAAALLAERADVDLTPLDDACAQMTDALARGDMLAWAEADEVFHETLVTLGGNARLVRLVMNCRDQVHRVRRLTQRVKPHPQPAKSIEEHRAIVAAIRGGDAARASGLYRAHRERGWRDQTNVLTQFGIQQA